MKILRSLAAMGVLAAVGSAALVSAAAPRAEKAGAAPARLIPLPAGPGAWRSAAPYALPPAPGTPRAGSREEERERADPAVVERLRRLQERRRELHRMGIRDQASSRRLLAPEYQARRAAERRAAGRPSPAGSDTLVVRVAGIRVGFDEARRATTGRWDLRPIWDPARDDTLMIDPPPHDSAYVAAHLEAMGEFWNAFFYGKLKLEYDVFPAGDSAVYTLDSLSRYSTLDPDRTGADWTFAGLDSLVRDCLRAADADTTWRLQDYDSYLLIHAGPDYQTDINRDSPADIPSFYIQFGDTLWTDRTDADSFAVLDATMVPETVSQDGLVGAINGVLAHEFGHQLGLPDVYDIFSGLPSVGFWDLMDSGNNVTLNLGVPVTGILPSTPGAWCRYLLSTYLEEGGGFLGVREVESVWADSLTAVGLAHGAGADTVRMLKVPLTAEEFYLIENRQDDLDGNRATVVNGELQILDGIFRPTGPDTLTGALYQDEATGVVLGPARFAEDDSTGERPPFDAIKSWEYDAGLPGPGVLVWHIDEAVLFDLSVRDFGGLVVNAYRDRRGVAVEEADAVPDLGDFRSFFWLGSQFDPWFAGNADTLTPGSFPSTATNLGGATGVRVTEVGPLGPRMFLRVDRGYAVDGFPVFVAYEGERGAEGGSAAAGDMNADGDAELVFARGSTVWALAGEETDPAALLVPGFPGVSGAADLGAPALGDLDADDTPELAARGSDGRIYLWRADGTPYVASSLVDDPFAAAITESVSVAGGPPLFVDLDGDGRDELLAGAGATLRAWEGSGAAVSERWRLPVSRIARRAGSRFAALAATDSAGDGGWTNGGRLVALTTGGEAAVLDAAGAPRAVWQAGSAERFAAGGWLLLADFDRATDGVLEVLAAGAGGELSLARADGTLLEGQWPFDCGAPVAGPPGAGDVDGDGRLELLVALRDTGLLALRGNGARILGTPWRAPLAPGSAPLAADLDGDGAEEVLVGASDGLVYAWTGDGLAVPGWPVGAGREPLCPVTLLDFRAGNGAAEIATLDGVGAMQVLRAPGWTAGGAIGWGAAYGDAARRARRRGSLGAPSAPSGTLAGAACTVYPNPVRGGETRVRVDLTRDADMTVEIFTLTGERVTSWSGPVAMPSDEWVWNTSGVASGVYLCRVRLAEGGSKASFMERIAIIR